MNIKNSFFYRTSPVAASENYIDFYSGDTKFICWCMGPTDPILRKNEKNIRKF